MPERPGTHFQDNSQRQPIRPHVSRPLLARLESTSNERRLNMRNANSTANKIKAKLAFHDVSDADALQQFTAVLQGMKNNPAYPNPPVDIATYEKGVDSFGTLLTDAQDGVKKAISAKDKQRVAVIKLYTLLGHYVEAHATTIPQPSIPAVSSPSPEPRLRRSRWQVRASNGSIAVRIAEKL